MRRAAAVLFCSVLFSVTAAVSASALTLKDIVELTKAGLGEEVLLALIEVDRGVYPIDRESLLKLKEAGVSDKVIAALVRSGREPLPEPVPVPAYEEPAQVSAPPPQVVVIEQAAPVQPVMVPVPVYIPVAPARRLRADHDTTVTSSSSTFIPFQSGPPVERPVADQKPKQPVYWGFGGKLRSDAWEPAGHRREGEDRE